MWTQAIKKWYRDKSFIVVDLPDGIRKGENHIETTRYFKPLEKPVSRLSALYQKLDGVQLEAMYLLGDFGVYGKRNQLIQTAFVTTGISL